MALLLMTLTVPSFAASPLWWTERGVIAPGRVADDFAVINQGQVKKLVSAAVAEMDDKLIGGAGSTLNSLVSSWDTNTLGVDDFAVVTVGQLKAVSKPIYQRLLQAGVIVQLPSWVENHAPSDDDYALANAGQAKHLFSFTVPNQMGVSSPAGWAGSKWTESAISVSPIQVLEPVFAQGILKNYKLKDNREDLSSSLAVELEYRSAEVSGYNLKDNNDNVIDAYRLSNDRDDGELPVYPFDIDGNTERKWWTRMPPGTLSNSGLSHIWKPLSDLNDTTVAIQSVDYDYEYPDPHQIYPWLAAGKRTVIKWSEVRLKLVNPSIVSDRQIIKEYWRSDERRSYGAFARRYRFVINPGQSRSSQEFNFTPGVQGEVYLEEAPPPILNSNISQSDSTGPRYRKIGLNGVPLSDSPPENQEENDVPPDETYVDAYTRNLRHAVTDIWSKVSSTEIPLSVRRTSVPESWSWNSSLHPSERTDRPFGAGFSSNLTPQISIQRTRSNLYDAESNAPIKANIIDENGSLHSFVWVQSKWVPSLEQQQDAKSCFNTLTRITKTNEPDVWELRKKYGATCYFEMMFKSNLDLEPGVEGTKILQSHAADRLNGSSDIIEYAYGRMTKVTDRMGNELHYEYPDEVGGSQQQSFIPSKIHDPKRPSQAIYIEQADGLVQTIWGPSGEKVHYSYAVKQAMIGGSVRYMDVLDKVYRGDSKVDSNASVVQYALNYSQEVELDVAPTNPNASLYGHIDIAVIKNELEQEYKFSYSTFLDASKTIVFHNNGFYYYGKTQSGGSRIISSIASPGDLQIVNFGGNRSLVYDAYGKLPASASITTTVSSPTTGEYTYTFSQPHAYYPIPIAVNTPPSVVTSFTRLTIASTLEPGVETYVFSPKAGMALEKATDRSGNTTTYSYDDIIASPHITFTTNGILTYDDPTREVSAIHSTNFNGVKQYQYDPASRQLKKITDEKGNTTEYVIDTGRRTKETIKDSMGKTLRITDFAYHPNFKGFMTQQLVQTTGLGVTPSEIPAPIGALRTDFEPDADGRLKVQKVYAGEDGTKPLITSYTYTANGSKKTITDPRNHTTTFDYELHTLRLSKVTYPDTTFKELKYDAHGNLKEEINEKGVQTFHAYDNLNRRIKTTIDLNGNGVADPRYTTVTPNAETGPSYNGDIVTETTYNDFNLPVFETDPKGLVTFHEYDGIGRRIRTTVNHGGDNDKKLITEYVDSVANTLDWVGGSVFDTSGFKPLRVKDPRGFVTEFVYDQKYRPIQTTLSDTSYSPTQAVVTTTEYDQVGNVVKVTDPLGNVTRTDFDGLNRPIRVVLPSKAGGPDSDVPYAERTMDYTPSGLVWRSKDELGHISYNLYDAAGRLTTTVMPPVIVAGQAQPMRPQIWQSYDEAGNVFEKSDPRGNIVETTYDERNRPEHVKLPLVVDAATGLLTHPETTTTYDSVGQVASITDPLGRTTYSYYDKASRNYLVVAPPIANQVHQTLTTHDPVGNILTVTNAKNQKVTNVYDELNRLETTTDHQQIVNTFAYDKAGNRTSVKDDLQQETTFTYDAQSRLRTQVFANADTWIYTYNAVNKLKQTDAKNVDTNYAYDVRNRLRKVTAPDLVRTMSYDAAGRLSDITEEGRPEANVHYEHDALARVIAETSQGITHHYAYDLAGNREVAEYGTGRAVSTTYDALNRPATIVEDGRITTYGYDLAGRALQLTSGNGQVTKDTYDELGRLTHRKLYTSAADLTATGVLAQFGWEHDEIGNVTEHVEEWKSNASRPAGTRTTTMLYDGANRLESEGISDPTSGLTTTVYSYDAANNRKSKTVTSAVENGYWEYEYNEANQLESWTKRDVPEGTLLASAVLGYDANGNRTGQELTDLTSSATHASLVDQGITYTAAASGSAGDAVSVSLRGSAANQPLSTTTESGNHVVVNLQTGPASADSLVNQGITYTTTGVHQPGQNVSLSLLANQPGITQEQVQVTGRDVSVQLATTRGAAASASRQGVTYQALTAGPEGNDVKLHFEKATPGQPASVSLAGNDVTVHLETGPGTADTLEVQGMSFATTTPHEAGREVSVSFEGNEPDQAASVQVVENHVQVSLETGPGRAAHASDQGIYYEAATAGPAGNDIEIELRAVDYEDPFAASIVTTPAKKVTVDLPWLPAKKAELALQGIKYIARQGGRIGNTIQVEHLETSPNTPTAVAWGINGVTVYLGRDPVAYASAHLYPEKGGGIVIAATNYGTAPHAYTFNIIPRSGANNGIDVYRSGNTVNVYLGTDAAGNSNSSIYHIVSVLASSAIGLPLTYTGSSNEIVDQFASISPSGGSDGPINAKAQQVATAINSHPILSNLVEAEITDGPNYPLSSTLNPQPLYGGEDAGAYRSDAPHALFNPYSPDLRITTNDVVDLLSDAPGVDSLIQVLGGNQNEVVPATVQLVEGGMGPEIKTDITQLVTLLNTEQSLVTITGSGTDKVLPMQRRALGGGVETPVITPTSQLAALFSASSLTSTLISAVGGSATEPVQLGTVELTGGGLGFTVTSSINSVVSAINGHIGASALVTATGTGTSHVQGLSRTLLRGGEPAILSDADDVVTLLTGHGLLSAAGSGSAPLQPMERSFLSSSISRTTYAWNHEDRLTGVKMPNGTQHGYSYDYRVRRVQTTRQNGPQAGQATSIVFSGGLSLAEYESAALAPITATSPTVHYMRGPDMGGGVGGMLYSIRGSTLKYSLSNGRGDIVAQSDENAAITWTASYEAYGKRPVETGVNHDKQRANSKDEDPTGLLNEGFRYRDIETGVWLSRDPAGFVDGPNLYAYVNQNPWSKFDAEGLFWSALITVGYAAYDTYQYATGKTTGAEYAQAMTLNGVALAADIGTAGNGGGIAVRAANTAIKVAKVIDKANNAVETAQAAIETTESIVAAVQEGDGRGLARTVGGALLDAATDKLLPKGGTYKLKDKDSVVRRTGQTKDLEKRKSQHARSEATKDLEFETDRRTDDYDERRGREEVIHDQYPEARSPSHPDGGSEGGLNKQRAISPDNPKLKTYREAERSRAERDD